MGSAMLDSYLRTLIQKLGSVHGVEPAFLAAMVMTESGGNTWRTRYERDYRYLYQAERFAKETGVSFETELIQQKTSWGLMQVMGGVARELGFKGLLPELCRPEVGIFYGIHKMKDCERRFVQNRQVVLTYNEFVVAAYNAGSPRMGEDGEWENEWHVKKVRAFYQQIKGTL